ncbi:hypothetical protein ACWFMI_24970 [Nocardiopsis terrae]|uniref:hypothetical protein n=1 Tax=Streptomyces sp. NPDC057554 TaxID=3350538 RepID=UPI0036B41558
MRPETRAYLDANRGPQFVSRGPNGDRLKVAPTPFDGVLLVTVDDHEDSADHALNREEAIRLRDWLTAHLGDNPGAAMAECVAHMVGEDRRTVAEPYCGWCGNDHLADIAQPPDAAPPAPPGTTVELSGSGDWMWTCDHRDCSAQLNPGGWFGTATGGFTTELSARQGLDTHLADVHPTQMSGWPDLDEEPDASTG